MKRFIIEEKIDTYDYVEVYETSDSTYGKDILEVMRKKYPYRLFRLVKVLK